VAVASTRSTKRWLIMMRRTIFTWA